MSKKTRFGDDEQIDVPLEPTEEAPVEAPVEPVIEAPVEPVIEAPVEPVVVEPVVVEPVVVEPVVVEPVVVEPVVDSVKRKIEVITASQMPEEQKAEYIARLTPKQIENVNRVPLSVYAKIRKIRKVLLSGMVAYPKAQGIVLASLEEWDGIFKNF